MGLWMAFSTLSTMDQIKFLPQPTGVMPSFSLSDMVARIHEAIKNQNFKVLFVATMIAAVVIGTGQVFDSYMNAFFWGFGTSETRWFALSFLGMAFAIVTVAPCKTIRKTRHHADCNYHDLSTAGAKGVLALCWLAA